MYKSFLLLLAFLAVARFELISAQTMTTVPSVRPETSAPLEEVKPEIKAEAKDLYNTGIDLLAAGEYSQAADSFLRALKVSPDYADAHDGLGRAYFKMRQWQKAIDSFHRAAWLNAKTRQHQEELHKTLVAKRVENEKADSKVSVATTQVTPVVQSQSIAASPAANVSANNSNPIAERVSLKTPSPSAIVPAPSVTSIAPVEDVALTKIYRVGPNDVLDIRLNDPTSDSKSTLFTITPAGLLEHPLLSEALAVSGLTVEEVAAKIEDEINRRALLENPKVAIGVRDYASHTILVSGLVKESGTKILRREAIPLYVVVADAQPLPEATKVTVVRNESNQMYEIDLAQSAEMNLLVRSGDVVTLLPYETQFIYIGGEVKSPGEKLYRRGLTLTQALLIAGGLASKAKFAQIARDDGHGFLAVTRIKLNEIETGKSADPLLKPGDRITILR